MAKTVSKQIVINISDDQTIIDLSKAIQQFNSEIYLKKMINGNIIEVNVKSFLGLITLQLHNNDKLSVRVVGEDCKEALEEVIRFFA